LATAWAPWQLASRRVKGRKIAIRGALLAAGFVLAGFVLTRAFKGFELSAVVDAIGDLSVTDVLSLLGVLVVLLVAQAYLSAAFVPGLSVFHGGLAWLGSNAVASVIPGPSDIPLRYKMFRSWGQPIADAATASAGASVTNVGTKLVLPGFAAVGIAIGHFDFGDVTSIVISAGVISATLFIALAYFFGTPERTVVLGDRLERLWARVRRRPASVPGNLGRGLVAQRRRTITLVRRAWKQILIGSIAVTVIQAGLFVMCIRAVGVPGSAVSTLALFCVFALVRGVTVIPTMPGDAGLSELAFVSLVTRVSGSATVNAVTAGVLVYRVLTWILLIPIGWAAIVVWRWTLRRGHVLEADLDTA
jgi:hypothetical protein